MLAALEQGRAADVRDRALAAEAQEQLVAHHRAADREGEGVEARMRADIRHQRREVQRLVALARDLDVIDMRVVGDRQLQRGIGLVVAAVRALMALDQHRARALLDHDERAGEQRGRLVAGRREHEMDRPLDRGAGRDVDHDAVAHEGGVERDRRIVGRDHLAEMLRRPAHRPPRAPAPSGGWSGRVSSVGEIGQLGHERAIDEHEPPAVDVGEQRRRHPWRAPSRRHRAGSRAASRRASARAGRCTSTPRRAGAAGPAAAKRSNAAARSGAAPGSLRLRRLPFGRELLLGGVLHQGQFSHCSYSAATGASWNCA